MPRLASLRYVLLLGSSYAFMYGGMRTQKRQYLERKHALCMAEEPSATMEQLRFLSSRQVRAIKREFGTPVYVYDERTLRSSAVKCLAFPNAYGLTVRFAMKSCPTGAVLGVMRSMGVHIDASSTHEVQRALRAGYQPNQISLSSQELPSDIAPLLHKGVHVNACSLRQLEVIGEVAPGSEVGVRFNPGLGSGGTSKTNVGGPSSSFGIWHELVPEVQAISAKHGLKVVRIHTHIGSGSDPAVWQRVALLSLGLVRSFSDVQTLNLGGGYKVARMGYEKETDLAAIGIPVREAFEQFASETGRQLKLEIEPGTYLVAKAGSIVSTVQDMVSTGTQGHTFLKLDTGMTEILRPSLYAAQHPIVIVGEEDSKKQSKQYVVVGHCCESGDLLSPGPGDAEVLAERTLEEPRIGDLCVIEGAGAYCAGMSAKNYNSFPEAAEVMIDTAGRMHLVRRRQTLEQIVQNELPYEVSH